MRIIKSMCCWVLMSGTSSWALAHTGHDMTMPIEQSALTQAEQPTSVTPTISTGLTHSHGHANELLPMDRAEHSEHGTEIYQATRLDTQWRRTHHGQDELSSELETWIGGDYNKLFIQADFDKASSMHSEYSLAPLYSRNIATFWDVQTGLRFRNENREFDQKHRVDAVLGLYGLAPYYFETKAYLYVGQDQYVAARIELERDLLLRQKLIIQPYLKTDLLLSRASQSIKNTGISKLQGGIQTRYEITKKVMPFIDVAYQYEKKDRVDIAQGSSQSATGWLYGVGITFKF